MLNVEHKILVPWPRPCVECCAVMLCRVVHVFVESRLLLVEKTMYFQLKLRQSRDRVKNSKKSRTDGHTDAQIDFLGFLSKPTKMTIFVEHWMLIFLVCDVMGI